MKMRHGDAEAFKEWEREQNRRAFRDAIYAQKNRGQAQVTVGKKLATEFQEEWDELVADFDAEDRCGPMVPQHPVLDLALCAWPKSHPGAQHGFDVGIEVQRDYLQGLEMEEEGP